MAAPFGRLYAPRHDGRRPGCAAFAESAVAAFVKHACSASGSPALAETRRRRRAARSAAGGRTRRQRAGGVERTGAADAERGPAARRWENAVPG